MASHHMYLKQYVCNFKQLKLIQTTTMPHMAVADIYYDSYSTIVMIDKQIAFSHQ